MSISKDYVNNLSMNAELASFTTPKDNPEVAPSVKIGDHAPDSNQLPGLQSPGRPVMITFLRHCGCPFSEKAFQQFRHISDRHPNVRFIAISHSSQKDTDEWVISVGGTGDLEVICDPDRTLYAKWGLGFSSYWANIGPITLWKTLQLGQTDNIYNRPTKSGYRWQTAGAFAVDVNGIVRWCHTSQNAPDIANYKDGMRAIGMWKEEEKTRARKSEDSDSSVSSSLVS